MENKEKGRPKGDFKLTPEQYKEIDTAFDALVEACNKHECPMAIMICTEMHGAVTKLSRAGFVTGDSPLPIRIAASAVSLAEKVERLHGDMAGLLALSVPDMENSASRTPFKDIQMRLLRNTLLSGRKIDNIGGKPKELQLQEMLGLAAQLEQKLGTDCVGLLRSIIEKEELKVAHMETDGLSDSTTVKNAKEDLAYLKDCLDALEKRKPSKQSTLFGDAELSHNVKEAFYGAFDVIEELECDEAEKQEKRGELCATICEEFGLDAAVELPDLIQQTEEHITLLGSMAFDEPKPGERTKEETVNYEKSFLAFLQATLKDITDKEV